MDQIMINERIKKIVDKYSRMAIEEKIDPGEIEKYKIIRHGVIKEMSELSVPMKNYMEILNQIDENFHNYYIKEREILFNKT